MVFKAGSKIVLNFIEFHNYAYLYTMKFFTDGIKTHYPRLTSGTRSQTVTTRNPNSLTSALFLSKAVPQTFYSKRRRANSKLHSSILIHGATNTKFAFISQMGAPGVSAQKGPGANVVAESDLPISAFSTTSIQSRKHNHDIIVIEKDTHVCDLITVCQLFCENGSNECCLSRKLLMIQNLS